MFYNDILKQDLGNPSCCNVTLQHIFHHCECVCVFFFLCVCFHTVGPTVFVCRGVVQSVWVCFCSCFECLVDSAAKPWCFISSHVTCTWFFFFFQHSHSNTHRALPHIYSSFGQSEMLDAWEFIYLFMYFLKRATFAMLIVVCLFRPETRIEWQNEQHSGHAQAHAPDERWAFILVPRSKSILSQPSTSISIFHSGPFTTITHGLTHLLILWTVKCFKSKNFFFFFPPRAGIGF